MAIALNAVSQFFDNYGNPLSGGKVWTYAAGTLNPLATYTGQDGNVANANPVVLDAAGRAQIWLTPNVPYKIVVMDASNVEVETTDEFYAGMNPEQLNIAGLVPASGGEYTGDVTFSGGVTFNGSAAQEAALLDSLGLAGAAPANLWINPEFVFNQSSATSAVDGAFGCDRVMALCDGGGALTTSNFDTAGLAIGGYAGRLIQADATAKRIGVCQIVEAKEVLAYRGKSMVLAAQVRCTAAISIRAALVAWIGTVDAPTHDVVNNWASTNYTASNFFVANTTTIATAAVALTANVWTEIAVSSVSPGGVVAPTTMKNLYMVFWTEAPAAQNVNLDFTAVRCGLGPSVPRWVAPGAATEFARCQRFYETGTWSSARYGVGGTAIVDRVIFSAPKRATPVVSAGGVTESNASGSTVGSASPGSMNYVYTVTTTGMASSSASWFVSAEF